MHGAATILARVWCPPHPRWLQCGPDPRYVRLCRCPITPASRRTDSLQKTILVRHVRDLMRTQSVTSCSHCWQVNGQRSLQTKTPCRDVILKPSTAWLSNRARVLTIITCMPRVTGSASLLRALSGHLALPAPLHTTHAHFPHERLPPPLANIMNRCQQMILIRPDSRLRPTGLTPAQVKEFRQGHDVRLKGSEHGARDTIVRQNTE